MRVLFTKSGFLAAAIVACGLISGTANADFMRTFSASSGSRAAQAVFSLSGSTLSVTLSNTSSADVLVPTDVLTAIFFNVEGNPAWTPVSAVLASGSTVVYDPDGQPTAGNVGGEWAYRSGLSIASLPTVNQGISSTGLDLFGDPNFNGPDLEDPDAVNGLQYGILSAGDNTSTGNGGISNTGGLIKNSVVFTLTANSSLSQNDIRNVWFQYGTDLREPRIPDGPSTRPDPEPVPEPATLTALLCMALAGAGVRVVRRGSRRA